MQEWISQALFDLRFAARTFIKRPGFPLVGTITLALGIGATTAVFSIVDAVLLRSLPYRNPSRLAAVWITSAREKGLAKIFATYADYLEFRRNTATLENVSAATWATRTSRVLTGRGTAREVLTIPATASFFAMLGVDAAIGRTFGGEDEGRGCSIVLAHGFWTTALDADRGIIGRSLTLDQKPCTVLGVMPVEFSFYPTQTQAWILLGPNFLPDQDRMLVGIFARLKPGVTNGQVEAELQRFYRGIHPGGEERHFEPVVYDLHGEFTFLAGRNLRTTLLLVFAAVLAVLLIGCLNVANLMLARLVERGREFAVRAALGSGQGRPVRQVLAESMLLSGFGAALGVALAYAAVRYFRVAKPIELSVGADAGINVMVLGFGIAVSIATTLIFGLLPALRGSRVDLIEDLKAAGRGCVPGRHALAKSVMAVGMALSFMLLVGAGLLITSAMSMGSERLGFSPDRVLSTRVSLPVYRYSNDTQLWNFYDHLLARLVGMPGAAEVTLASEVPPEAGGNQRLEVHGRAAGETHDVGADAVSSGFFACLNIPLLRGRVFGAQDRENSQPVAIVNEALVKEYFPTSDPLGQEVRIPGGSMPWLTIVGVVGNLKHTQLMNEMSWIETPIFCRPLTQEPRPSIQIAVRTPGETGPIQQEIRNQIARLDPSIPLTVVETLRSRLAKTLAYPRFRATTIAFFALAGLLLSAVGLYGVLSQLVAQRIPEFGIRRAVGAQTHHLLWLVVRQGGVPVLAGLLAGISLTLAFSRLLNSLLYGVHATDLGVFAAPSLVLLAVACAAILSPAKRAAGVDPMIAPRDE